MDVNFWNAISVLILQMPFDAVYNGEYRMGKRSIYWDKSFCFLSNYFLYYVYWRRQYLQPDARALLEDDVLEKPKDPWFHEAKKIPNPKALLFLIDFEKRDVISRAGLYSIIIPAGYNECYSFFITIKKIYEEIRQTTDESLWGKRDTTDEGLEFGMRYGPVKYPHQLDRYYASETHSTDRFRINIHQLTERNTTDRSINQLLYCYSYHIRVKANFDECAEKIIDDCWFYPEDNLLKRIIDGDAASCCDESGKSLINITEIAQPGYFTKNYDQLKSNWRSLISPALEKPLDIIKIIREGKAPNPRNNYWHILPMDKKFQKKIKV